MHDPTLLPPAPPLLQDARFDQHRLITTAHDRPFTLMGRLAAATGSTLQGAGELWVLPMRILRGLRVAGTAQSGAASFREARRQLGTIEEHAHILPDQPGMLWQWRATQSVELTLEWLAELHINTPDSAGLIGPVRWNSADRWLFVQAENSAHAVLYCFDRAVTWEVSERADSRALHVAVHGHLAPGTTMTMAALASPHAQALDGMARTLDRPSYLLRSHAARIDQLEQHSVRVQSPDAALNEACHDALLQLDAALVQVPGRGRSFAVPLTDSQQHNGREPITLVTPASVHMALAALALGDVGTTRDVILFLGGLQDAAGRIPASCTMAGTTRAGRDEDTLLFLLLAARYVGWTGDIPFARAQWPHVTAALQTLPHHTRGYTPVLRELATAAESIGMPAVSIPKAAGNDDACPSLALWSNNTDRAALPNDEVPAAAAAVAALLHGWLGAEPDATRGRLRLRPRIPGDCEFLTVENLRVGDAQLGIRYVRRATHVSLAFDQTAGTVPLRLILETHVAAPAITGCTVDGEPATLDVTRHGGYWVCPLQIVIDNPREVVIETAG